MKKCYLGKKKRSPFGKAYGDLVQNKYILESGTNPEIKGKSIRKKEGINTKENKQEETMQKTTLQLYGVQGSSTAQVRKLEKNPRQHGVAGDYIVDRKVV